MYCLHRWSTGIGLVALLAAVLAGCGRKAAAVVDGQAIPRDRFYELLERDYGAPLLVNLIADQLVLVEAARQNVMPTDADVARRLAEIKKANPAALQGLSDSEARIRVTVNLAVKNLAFKGVKVTENELKALYDKYQAQGAFDQPEKVVVRRAVFKTKEQAEAAHTTLKKAGVEFTVVLGQSIDHPSIRQNGGILPDLIRTKDPKHPFVFAEIDPISGQTVHRDADLLLGAGVAKILFGLPEKGITDVLKCPFPEGYQVLQVEQHQMARKLPYAEVKEDLELQALIEKRFQKEKIPQGIDPLTYYKIQLVDQLRRKAKIEIHLERLKDVIVRPELWPNPQQFQGGAP